MNYKELYEYEHKKLPLLLLGRKEGIDIKLWRSIGKCLRKSFEYYCESRAG